MAYDTILQHVMIVVSFWHSLTHLEMHVHEEKTLSLHVIGLPENFFCQNLWDCWKKNRKKCKKYFGGASLYKLVQSVYFRNNAFAPIFKGRECRKIFYLFLDIFLISTEFFFWKWVFEVCREMAQKTSQIWLEASNVRENCSEWC